MSKNLDIDKDKENWTKWGKWFCEPNYVSYILKQVQEFNIIDIIPANENTVSFMIVAERLFCEADSYQWAYTPIGKLLVIRSDENTATVLTINGEEVSIPKRDVKVVGENRNFDMYNLIAGKPFRYGGGTGKTMQDFHKEYMESLKKEK